MSVTKIVLRRVRSALGRVIPFVGTPTMEVDRLIGQFSTIGEALRRQAEKITAEITASDAEVEEKYVAYKAAEREHITFATEARAKITQANRVASKLAQFTA